MLGDAVEFLGIIDDFRLMLTFFGLGERRVVSVKLLAWVDQVLIVHVLSLTCHH